MLKAFIATGSLICRHCSPLQCWSSLLLLLLLSHVNAVVRLVSSLPPTNLQHPLSFHLFPSFMSPSHACCVARLSPPYPLPDHHIIHPDYRPHSLSIAAIFPTNLAQHHICHPAMSYLATQPVLYVLHPKNPFVLSGPALRSLCGFTYPFDSRSYRSV
ncbi:hypothetical protein CALCODRAFT_54574 [Calocera cornea HHB12733]|uniref:Secreted protein n=1 Tax=Calocera cornea HHB12733 TaxID=1353952 RepID=A0A165DQV2_9BASI|nr:hypothetical protein CALCODRAFT_54574 [Calocera cornea HHB12733]